MIDTPSDKIFPRSNGGFATWTIKIGGITLILLCSLARPADAFCLHQPSTFRVQQVASTSAGWRSPGGRRTTLWEQKNDDASTSSNPLGFLMNPYESKIPKEIEKDIYAAEANTEAARDRNTRVAIYTLVAIVGVLMAFFNFFISQLRVSETPDGLPFDLNDSTFAWVDDNFLTQLFFMNKIGGGFSLLLGAGAGLLAEAELDTRRINAEKIYEELVRRREEKERKVATPKKSKKKKRKGTKESKRLGALVEVMDDTASNDSGESVEVVSDETQQSSSEPSKGMPVEEPVSDTQEKGNEGIIGKIKGFYERADSMAASQALLLNKQLEDAGVLEKITDESGLRVVGKEAASNSTTSANKVIDPSEPKQSG